MRRVLSALVCLIGVAPWDVNAQIVTQTVALNYEGIGLANEAVLSGDYPGISAATVTHYGLAGDASTGFEDVRFWNGVSPGNGYGNLTNVAVGPRGLPSGSGGPDPAWGVIRIAPNYPGTFVRVRGLDLASFDDDDFDESITGVFVIDPSNPVTVYGSQAGIFVNGDFNNTTHTHADFFGVPADGPVDGTVAILWDAQEGRVAIDNVQFEVIGPAPEVLARNDFYTVSRGGTLAQADPGVLANDLLRDNTGPLSATLLTGAAHGALELSGKGGFTYTPTNGTGMDGFVYRASDAAAHLSEGVTLISVLPPDASFHDDFERPTGAEIVFPWNSILGNWTVSNGVLEGSAPPQTHAWATYGNNWTDYSVEARASLPEGPAEWSVGGRLNPETGEMYQAVLVEGGGWTLNLVKLHAYEGGFSGTPLTASVPISTPGTNVHTLKMTFQGNQIIVHWDGNLMMEAADNNFEGAPYASGGVALGMFAFNDPVVVTFESVTVGALEGPTGADLAVEMLEDTSTNLVLQGGSGQSSPLAFGIDTAPAHGSLSGLNANTGAVTYSPDSNYFGADTFTYTANDGSLLITGRVSITVGPVNDAPVFDTTPENLQILELAPLSVTNSASDADVPFQTLTYSLPEGPGNAVIDANGVIHWTPGEAQGPGTNIITTVVTDGQVSITNSFVVIVDEVNEAPLAQNQNQTVIEDTATTLTWMAFDSDLPPNPLSYGLVSQPSHGTLSNFDTNSGTALYSPDPDYSGSDGFLFSVSDGMLSSTGSLSITVAPVDDPPKAIDRAVQVVEDTLTNLVLTASDVDTVYDLTETLSVAMASEPDNWNLGAGSDKVSGLASDDGDGSYIDSGTTANTLGQFRVATARAIRDRDSIRSVTLRATSTRSTKNADYQLSAVVGAQVQDGGVQVAKNNYRLNSSRFATRPGGAAWTLLDIQNLELRLQNLESLGVRCTHLDAIVDYQSDLNTTNVAFAILEPPTNGVLAGFNPHTGEVSYIPINNYSGSDAFKFTATIDSLVSTGTVLIGVSPVNDPPVFSGTPANVTIEELTPLSVANGASDADIPAQPLSYTLVDPPSGASIDANGVINWTPAADQGPGTYTITTIVSDGLASSTNSFTVTVLEGAPPVIEALAVSNGIAWIAWKSEVGRTYHLQYKDDMKAVEWTEQPVDIPGSGGAVTATDSVGEAARRFYRVIRVE